MSLPISTPTDAERAVCDFLAPLLPSGFRIDVRGGGGRFVRVRRIGGVEESPNHDRPVLDIMVWHDSDYDRMKVALLLWASLRSLNNDRAGDGVLTYRSTTLGPRQVPDPADDTKTVCMFTVELIARPV